VGRPPAAGLFLQTGQPRQGETLAPLADDLARGIETRGDDLMGEAGGGEEHDLGANYIALRPRIPSCPGLEFLALGATPSDDKRARPRQRRALPRNKSSPESGGSASVIYVIVFMKSRTKPFPSTLELNGHPPRVAHNRTDPRVRKVPCPLNKREPIEHVLREFGKI
jgi:hypothetical protein